MARILETMGGRSAWFVCARTQQRQSTVVGEETVASATYRERVQRLMEEIQRSEAPSLAEARTGAARYYRWRRGKRPHALGSPGYTDQAGDQGGSSVMKRRADSAALASELAPAYAGLEMLSPRCW